MISVSRFVAALAFSVVLTAPITQAQWTAPTPEELSMTSIPEVPGAAALYLSKEETADDGLHMQSFYYRIKVLTEGGRDLANVELPFAAGESGFTIDSVAGRTIHPDGTIIPFTGKPFEKLVEKMQGYKLKVKVFTLPAVEVGSIIEYRYVIRMEDHMFRRPEWNVQTDLFTRKAHYMWRPTDLTLTSEDGKQVSSSVAWTPILPPGVTIKQTEVRIKSGSDAGHTQLDLDVQNILPLPKEQFMPPMQSVAYKVMFFYTSFHSTKEYWTSEGKHWAKARDKFIGPGSAVKAAVAGLVTPTDTQEQKARKLYAAVMTLENTDFTRGRSSSEEHSDGLKEIRSADDIWTRKRGDGDQIAELYVGMARAAGLKAYVMGVANRRQRFFVPGYLSTDQIDDLIAIVNVDGKDVFLDPGERYCAFGRLAWVHSMTGGLRETDGGAELALTDALSYKDTHISRVADLKLDDLGVATGSVILTYTGDEAMTWRHDALRGDETSLKEGLRSDLEKKLPGGMEIKVAKIDNLTEYEQPLKVTYEVTGPIGNPTGKRLLVAADLFESNTKPRFPESKRDLPVDMKYPSTTQDVVRLTFTPAMTLESSPAVTTTEWKGAAAFNTLVATTQNSITFRSNLTVGKTIVTPENYNDLRDFYSKVEARDQEPVVLTRSGAAAPRPGSGGN